MPQVMQKSAEQSTTTATQAIAHQLTALSLSLDSLLRSGQVPSQRDYAERVRRINRMRNALEKVKIQEQAKTRRAPAGMTTVDEEQATPSEFKLMFKPLFRQIFRESRLLWTLTWLHRSVRKTLRGRQYLWRTTLALSKLRRELIVVERERADCDRALRMITEESQAVLKGLGLSQAQKPSIDPFTDSTASILLLSRRLETKMRHIATTQQAVARDQKRLSYLAAQQRQNEAPR